MPISNKKPAHPGSYVRENIIPAGMSVTDAANRLGIGRPALSNFLNGKSALSPEMAVRLEKAFGADRKRLLDMQAAYDLQERRSDEKEVAVRAFVPNFLTIKARQIEDWAESQLDARTHLPVFLRKLVHSTGNRPPPGRLPRLRQRAAQRATMVSSKLAPPHPGFPRATHIGSSAPTRSRVPKRRAITSPG